MAEKTFKDPILGRCSYSFFYLVNDLYGGYSYSCERGHGALDYGDPKEVLEKAAEAKFDKVALAGGAWKEIGRKGWGEEVTLDQAKWALEDLRRRRR